MNIDTFNKVFKRCLTLQTLKVCFVNSDGDEQEFLFNVDRNLKLYGQEPQDQMVRESVVYATQLMETVEQATEMADATTLPRYDFREAIEDYENYIKEQMEAIGHEEFESA